MRHLITEETFRQLRDRQTTWRRDDDRDGKKRGLGVEWCDILDLYWRTRKVKEPS